MIVAFPERQKPWDLTKQQEQWELNGFKRKVLREALSDTLQWKALLEEAKASGFRLSINTLLEAQREIFSWMELLWRGLPPKEADEYVEKLARLFGPEWLEMRAKIKALALRAIAQAEGAKR
jgi:hypothetical protein